MHASIYVTFCLETDEINCVCRPIGEGGEYGEQGRCRPSRPMMRGDFAVVALFAYNVLIIVGTHHFSLSLSLSLPTSPASLVFRVSSFFRSWVPCRSLTIALVLRDWLPEL